jgi:S-(hydroxymethyl)glutathione dehydrogenase/alcohol dehydrogenase
VVVLKAAVLRELHKPLSVEDIPFPACSFGSVMVKVTCAGICGAQLQEIDGLKGDPSLMPHMLGHEGCGTVLVGTSKFHKGDKVVIHWRKGSGIDAPRPTGDWGPTKYGPCACFCEFSEISENRLTKIPDWVPDDLACLLGCCLSTALATVENNIKWGERVLVLGCGGVGMSMVFALRANHCIAHAVDRAPKPLPLFVRSFSLLIPKDNFDVIIDTTGNADLINIAMNHAKGWQKLILVGQGNGLVSIDGMFAGEGRTIMATQGGGFNPDTDIPRYVNMWKNGALDGYEHIITHRIKIEQINDGIALMRNGKAGRVLIEMN